MRDMLRYFTYHRFDCAIHSTRDFIEIIYIFISIIVYTIIRYSYYCIVKIITTG